MSKLPVKCPGCSGVDTIRLKGPDEVRRLIAVLESALEGPGPQVVCEEV